MTGNCDVAFATLVDYVEGTIAAETSARLESHLAGGCRGCEHSLIWLRRTIQLMRTDASVAPPSWVVEFANNLFRQHNAKLSWTKRMAAFLMFDSGLQFSPAGTRSAGTMVRQVLYGTEEFDIDFLIQESPYGRTSEDMYGRVSSVPPGRTPLRALSCQILPRVDVPERILAFEVTLTRGKQHIFTGRASPWGEFSVDDLSPGKYDLHVSIDEDGEIVVEGIEV